MPDTYGLLDVYQKKTIVLTIFIPMQINFEMLFGATTTAFVVNAPSAHTHIHTLFCFSSVEHCNEFVCVFVYLYSFTIDVLCLFRIFQCQCFVMFLFWFAIS